MSALRAVRPAGAVAMALALALALNSSTAAAQQPAGSQPVEAPRT